MAQFLVVTNSGERLVVEGGTLDVDVDGVIKITDDEGERVLLATTTGCVVELKQVKKLGPFDA